MPEADEQERFITGLRLAAGVRPDVATALGRQREATLRRLETLGLVGRLQSGAYALTARGREVADAVMAEF